MLNLIFTLILQSPTSSALQCVDCNVIVIAMDALQAQRVHHLGYKRETTPNLDQLAASGFTFKEAISPASWTVPTYLSIFSSTYPSVHGLTNRYTKFSKDEKVVDNFAKRKPELVTLAQIFKESGYRTGGFTGDAGVSAVLGYDKGFDAYTDDVQFGGLDHSSEQALKWMKEGTGRFFLFVHGYDSHGQFDLPKDYKSRFWSKEKATKFSGTRAEQEKMRERGLRGEDLQLSADDKDFWNAWYDGKIADADERLGNFLRQIPPKIRKKSVIVVLSDHGTESFEHGRVDHGHTLYDELIHVPFVIVVPQAKGKAVSGQVTTLDLAPTLVDLIGLKAPAAARRQMRGTSLVSFMKKGRALPRDIFSETDYRNYTHKRSIRSADGWKYIRTIESGDEELYNLRADPGEKDNLKTKQKKKLKELSARLEKHLSAMPILDVGALGGCLPVYKGQCEEQPYYQ